ncbi:hypothetical protein F9B85_09990 [Heliorestis acidaminivorans]|uniref:Uncharacterized protein n=1 Tax=Heliorestis acidaminivorans TaxID=553427 RepID=A0A6I0EY05_9FIRM|nr:hypothetical protein [Heliorestis acidaminivorans]KAB2952133.1 hypothetical protein F9B85_09990 [Heliorestis acidaminivorans]
MDQAETLLSLLNTSKALTDKVERLNVVVEGSYCYDELNELDNLILDLAGIPQHDFDVKQGEGFSRDYFMELVLRFRYNEIESEEVAFKLLNWKQLAHGDCFRKDA